MHKSDNLYNFLQDAGCCKLCCLRFLKGRGDDFLNPDITLKTKGINDIHLADENSEKCVACLGLFNENNLSKIVAEISKHDELQKYNCDKLLTSISLPLALHMRQLSLWFALIEKFGSVINQDEYPDTPLKEVLKIVLNPRICEATGKTFDQNGMMVNIFFEYGDDSVEIQKLVAIKPELFEHRKSNKRFRKEFMTRNAFEKHFVPSKISSENYIKHITVPPTIPVAPIYLDKITIVGPTIFLAGRYRKLSRTLSQTPWVLGGKRMMEDSVQEIIMDSIAPYFGGSDIEKTTIFSSSGREDVDVRCLGKGRPFVLEIPDCRRTSLPDNIATNVENSIDQSGKVSVRDLQVVQREELVHIKTGEEKKKKIYRALCILKNPVSLDILEKLNIPDGFTTHQITPIRVLHRRPLHTRPRVVHSVKTRVCKDNHKVLVMDIVTQAGTYIKELVHGEFGRTSPSLASIIDQWIDIMALDVVGIDLDWPNEIQRTRNSMIA